ncbi:MAG: DUF721 domain-containing protein [bacterium]|nr:DUF721 domain-containing protein [bacterium]
MKEKKFEKIGDLLSELVQKKGWNKFLALEQLKKKWPEIVGQNIGNHTTPLSITHKKLFIQVDSSIWANQLNFLKDKIMETINQYYKKELVNEIFFTVK